MAGRDLSAELFDTPAKPEPAPSEGRNLGAELFDTPAPVKKAEAKPVSDKTVTKQPPPEPAPAPALTTPIAPAPTRAKKQQPVLRDDFTFGDPMGSDLGAAIMADTKPAGPDLGVMDNAPKGKPQKDAFLPIRPEVRQALITAYQGGSPAERAKLEKLEGVKGDVIREYAKGFKARQAKRRAEFEKQQRTGVAIPGFFGLEEQFDPSVEARTARLIAAGERPEFARVAAERSARAGVPVGQEIKFMQSEGTLEKTDFDFEMFKEYRDANPVIRATVAGVEGFKQGVLGVNEAVADALGFDTFAKSQAAGAKESRTAVESMGENSNYLARQFEGAVSSITQQLPSLFAGTVTGSQALVLGSMFVQVFGQEYSAGRAKGLDGAQASTRAGLYGAFEIIGERLGLKFEMDNLRRATQGMKTDQLRDFLANTLKKELPGEYLTTTGQFLTDKSAVGLNKDATMSDYLQQMADTTVQTVMQSGIMTGGIKAIEKGVTTFQSRETEEPIPTAEQLMREKGFIVKSKRTETGKTTTETALEEAAGEKATTDTAVTPTETPEAKEERAAKRQAQVDEIATRLVETSGIDPDTAVKIAEGRVRAQEEQEEKRQDKLQREVTKRETLVAPPENRVQEITDDLIGAGMPPVEAAQRAVLMAQQEAENDALAEREAANVGKSITATGELGTGVSGERGAGVPAGGTAKALTTGLVPAGTTAGEFTPGETIQSGSLKEAQEAVSRAERELIIAQENGDLLETSRARAALMQAQERLTEIQQVGQPSALTEEQQLELEQLEFEEDLARRELEEAKNGTNDWDKARQDAIAAANERRAERLRQQEEASGAETIEAEQTEAQGAEESEAGVPPTTGKRGRPRLAPAAKLTAEDKRRQQRTAYKAVEKRLNDAERELVESAEPVNEDEATSDEHLDEMYDNKTRQRQSAINRLYDISKENRGKPGQRALELLSQNASTAEIKVAAEGHQYRKQRAASESVSKSVEQAASETVADEKLGSVVNGAQAITQIIKTGTEFQKLLAKRLRSFVSNVKVVVVEANQPIPEALAKNPKYQREWDRARALFIENYATGAKTIYVRGASFGASQGVNNVTLLHELWHAATNKKVELGRQAITKGLHKGSQLVRATEDLIQIMNNAGERFNELAAQGRLPAHISRLAEFGEIFDDPREFIAYGMTDPAFQEFLKSAGSLGGTTSYWSAFVDALRRLIGMDPSDTNALADLLNVTDTILTARPVGRLDLMEGASPMALFGFGKPKDSTTEFAGETISTKPSANAKRLAALLGAKLYGDPTDIAKVSIKEIFQNSFDAIKGALEKGQLTKGKIDIKLDEAKRTITVTDNGLGMPASVMGNEFLTIAGTVKETDRASGGLGIAKMLFLFGNEKLEVVSLRNGVLARMVTTGEEVMAALDDPSLAPKITTSTDPKVIEQYTKTLFPDGHGTTIVVKIPKTYKDASTGEEKEIPFTVYRLQESPVLEKSPLFDNIEVTMDGYGHGPSVLPIGANFPIDQYTPFANVNFDWGTARVYVEKKVQDYMFGDNTHILSNGLWQFDTIIKDRPTWDGEKIKRNFYVDVSPKVKPEDAGYPFDLNRQGFAPSIRDDFLKIFRYITAIYQQQQFADESKSFGQIQYVNSDGTLTKPEELVPEVPATPTAFTMIKPDDQVEVREGIMYVNGRAVPELTDADLKNTSIRVDELTIPQDKIDTNRVMVHDNTLVKNTGGETGLTIADIKDQMPAGWRLEEEKSDSGAITGYFAIGPNFEVAFGSDVNRVVERLASEHNVFLQIPFKEAKLKTLSEVARETFGKKYDEYLAGIGSIFMELRNALATQDNGRYSDILNEAIGISIDKEYYGVSIRIPFSGLYINPASTSMTDNSRQIAYTMVGTMIHEMAHHKVRGHNAEFASEMQRVMNLLEVHPTFDLADAKKRMTDHIQKHINIFDFLNGEFKNGNLEPRGNRFQDASAIEAGNDGGFNTVEGAGGTAEQRDGPGVSGGVEPSYQGTGEVGVGAGNAGEAAEDGEDTVRTQATINREVDIAIEKVRISRNAEEVARQSKLLQALRDPRQTLPALRQIWKSATYAQRLLLVKLPTTEFLSRWGGSSIPELINTNVLLEKMGGLTQQLLHSSAVMAQTIHRAFKQDKTLQRKLEDVAYASTLAQIDPSNPDAAERSPKLDQMYKDLGAKGQQIFKLILEHYQNMSDYFAQLLDEQIANSNVTLDTQNRLMAKIREIYETGQKIKPYIPLVRRGDFWLAVGSGKHRQFFTFATMNERDAAAEAMAKERRTPLEQLKEDQDFVLGNDIGTLRRASFDSSSILKSLFDVIDAENFSDPNVREELKDSIYQLYLTTMPEQSFRRQFINRKNITGFSTDLLRNFSTTGVKMATQLAKIKYAPLLRNSLSAAQDSIVGREELQPFITEMQARVAQQLNPGERSGMDRVGDFLNRSAFIWYLSGASSALLQPLGVFQTGAPILMSRYGQINGARELTKMLRVWDQYGTFRTNPDGSMSFVPPSIANAKGMTDDEKRAIREMIGRDVSQSTYASAMFGYKSIPTEDISGVVQKTKRGLAMATGGLMHSTERLSREIIYLASYRLNRKAGKSHEEAVNQAVIDTNESLGNYGQYNRPLIMQKGLGKVVLQFTMYPLHVTLFLMRNFKRMLPLLNKEGKWEATKIFFGTLGTTMILAGASGLPMFSAVMGLLGWMWRDEEKPQEFKDMDYETWWRTEWLPQQIGHMEINGKSLADVIDRGAANALTGWDIASRTSLNDLWLRDTKETKTAREGAVALAMEKAGPSAAMILSLADAYEAFINGDYQKGVEKMSPALIRNFILAHKYAQAEIAGVTIGKGEPVMDAKGAEILVSGGFTTGELLGQAIGFRSDLLAYPQKVAFKLNAQDQKVDFERTKLMNNIAREFFKGQRTGDYDGYLEQLEKRDKFNTKYPEKAIDDDQLENSIEKRLEEIGKREAWSGMPITEKNMPVFAESALSATKELDRRNKEVLERQRKEKK